MEIKDDDESFDCTDLAVEATTNSETEQEASSAAKLGQSRVCLVIVSTWDVKFIHLP